MICEHIMLIQLCRLEVPLFMTVFTVSSMVINMLDRFPHLAQAPLLLLLLLLLRSCRLTAHRTILQQRGGGETGQRTCIIDFTGRH